MALSKGVNSYGTVEEGDAYFDDRLDVAAWTDADATQKAQALITATNWLEQLDWAVVAVNQEQALIFPTTGSYFEPRFGKDVTFTNETPKRVMTALFELAYHFLNNDGILDDTGGVRNLTIGPINLIGIRPVNKMPDVVNKQLQPLLNTPNTRSWWRAN